MEGLFNYLVLHLNTAHWILFVLLLLTGLNFPLSEDLILLIGGAISSAYAPDKRLLIFVWMWVGSFLSGWEAYAIGRFGRDKIYKIRWFNRVVTPEKVKKLHDYLDYYGLMIFFIGRLIPFGVRNVMFMASGMERMPFWKFVLRDLVASLFSVSLFYYLGYVFGENYSIIWQYLKKYDMIILFILIVSGCVWYIRHRRKHKKEVK